MDDLQKRALAALVAFRPRPIISISSRGGAQSIEVDVVARLADSQRRRGLSPVHYTDEYHGEIWDQLRQAGV